MSALQDQLTRAAVELGLSIELDHRVMLTDRSELVSVVWFPDLGAPKGTLVFQRSLPASHVHALQQTGYTVSIIAEPPDLEPFDLDSFAEMFAEWGWTGKAADRPAWMSDFDGNA